MKYNVCVYCLTVHYQRINVYQVALVLVKVVFSGFYKRLLGFELCHNDNISNT
jgi:hypothetical protein